MYSNFLDVLAIFIYCVPLTLMLTHYRVSYSLRQYKSHLMTAKA